MFPKEITGASERGQAVMEMAMLAPVLLALVFLAADLSIQAITARQCASAARAAAVEAAAAFDAQGSGRAEAPTESQLEAYVTAHFPGVAGAEVTLSSPQVETVSYTHTLYDTADTSSARKRAGSTVTRGKVSVTVHVEKNYVTPVGFVIDALDGAAGGEPATGYACTATSEAVYDLTGDGGHPW